MELTRKSMINYFLVKAIKMKERQIKNNIKFLQCQQNDMVLETFALISFIQPQYNLRHAHESEEITPWWQSLTCAHESKSIGTNITQKLQLTKEGLARFDCGNIWGLFVHYSLTVLYSLQSSCYNCCILAFSKKCCTLSRTWPTFKEMCTNQYELLAFSIVGRWPHPLGTNVL